MLQVIIVVVVILVIAALLVIYGLRNPKEVADKAISERINEFAQTGEQVSLEKIELSQPFKDRVIYPIARALGELAVRFTPQNALQNISKKLELAGSPPGLDPTLFLAFQFGAALIFGGLVFFVLMISPLKWPLGKDILFGIGFSVLGFFFPTLWIGGKISRRQKDIRKAMPDALDLLTICVESGLGFDSAMQRVSEKWKTELSLAFARVITEVQLGKVRREAMRDMAERIDIPELTSFVAAVIQSEQLGVSLAKVLHIQADQMRVKRRQIAEEEAHKAPLKMLIPMALLIFPALVIVLLTPAGLQLINSSLKGMMSF
jgi:tight adherence protein C